MIEIHNQGEGKLHGRKVKRHGIYRESLRIVRIVAKLNFMNIKGHGPRGPTFSSVTFPARDIRQFSEEKRTLVKRDVTNCTFSAS